MWTNTWIKYLRVKDISDDFIQTEQKNSLTIAATGFATQTFTYKELIYRYIIDISYDPIQTEQSEFFDDSSYSPHELLFENFST